MSERVKITVSVNWRVAKAEEPDHSYIYEKTASALDNREVRYGPIPDVLVGEVLHELRTMRQETLNNSVYTMLRGARE